MDDETVYRRTRAGQAALIGGTPSLSPWEQRFLGMVTGHTPLRVLLDLCPNDVSIATSLHKLIGLRLIEAAETDRPIDLAGLLRSGAGARRGTPRG